MSCQQFIQSLRVNVRVGGILVRRHQQRGGRGEGRVGGADTFIDIIDIVDIRPPGECGGLAVPMEVNSLQSLGQAAQGEQVGLRGRRS